MTDTATPETQTETTFERDVRSTTSLARSIAVVALTPDVSSDKRHKEYPPTIHAREMQSFLWIRDDNSLRTQEEQMALTDQIKEKLVRWATEGIFEIVPLPEQKADDNIGFRLTPAGADAAIRGFTAFAGRLKHVESTARDWLESR